MVVTGNCEEQRRLIPTELCWHVPGFLHHCGAADFEQILAGPRARESEYMYIRKIPLAFSGPQSRLSLLPSPNPAR